MNENYKRKYHPLVIILYSQGLLSYDELQKLPKNTKWNWNKFNDEDYYGYDWIEEYLNRFNDVSEVFKDKYTYRTARAICSLSKGFKSIINKFSDSKKLFNKHAENIVYAIEHTKRHTNSKIKKICKFYGVSYDWYYQQKNKFECKLSKIKRCFRQYPNQLTIKEVQTIEDVLLNPNNAYKTKTTIYYDTIFNDLITCAYSTFMKYSRMIAPKDKRRKSIILTKSYKAEYVFEALHVDVTHVPTLHDGVQKVAFVKDNKSLALLNYATTDNKADSEFIRDLLNDTFDKYNLFDFARPISVVSDGGPENRGKVIEWIDSIEAPLVVIKITASTPDFPFSNNMAESTHKIYKSEFLKGEVQIDKVKHEEQLALFMEYYNNKRYPIEHFGLTCMQVMKGAVPNRRMYSDKIQKAKADRVVQNQNFNHCQRLFN